MPSVRFDVSQNFPGPFTEKDPFARAPLVLSSPSNNAIDIAVNYYSTRGNDLVGDRAVIRIMPGQTQVELQVPIIDDVEYEGDESIFFEIVSAVGAEIDSSTEYSKSVTALLLDDDQPTLPLVRLNDFFSILRSETAGNLRSAIVLERPYDRDISVIVRTTFSDLSAPLAIDDRELTIDAGKTSTEFEIAIVNDRIRNNDRLIKVELITAENAEINRDYFYSYQQDFVIRDDDGLKPLVSPTIDSQFAAKQQYQLDIDKGSGYLYGDQDYYLGNFPAINFLDGRLVFDVADRAAVAYRMYDTAFNREPDSLGLNGWISALESGTELESMAQFFAVSTEFQSTYGALTNRSFVEQLYRNVLDREGDAGGIAFWTGQLDAGALTRGGVLAGFSEAPEHVEKLRPAVEAGLWDQDEDATAVARLYHAALDRAPDASGLTYWTRAIEGGQPLADLSDAFAGSAEFGTRYGALSSEGYVRQLYRNVLDREGEAGGVAFWTGEIASGRRDRGDVLLEFSQSPEFQAKTQPLVEGGILLA